MTPGSFYDELEEIARLLDDPIFSALDKLAVEGSRICPKCSSNVPKDAKYCPACGYAQPPLPAEEDVETTVGEAEKTSAVKCRAGNPVRRIRAALRAKRKGLHQGL